MAVSESTNDKGGSQSITGKWLERNDSKVKEFKHSVKLFSKSPLAVLGLILIVAFLLVAIFAPVLATYEPDYMDVTNADADPGGSHILGTDDHGGDIYSKIIWGSRVSIQIGVMVVASAIIVGVVVGSVAGYYGGIIDEIMMRVTDIFLGFPSLVLAMVICAAMGSSLTNVMIAMTVVWWPIYARLIRGQVLSIKERKYIEAARAVGASDWRIIYKHIMPNSFSPIIVQATLDLGSVIITAAALSFIGLGAEAGAAEWGRMVSDGRQALQFHPGETTFPGLAILLVCLGFNLLGDGLRDILDPKLRR